jgi:hypothetical protein
VRLGSSDGGVGHASDQDRRHRRARCESNAVDVVAGDEIRQHGQRGVEAAAPLGSRDACRVPRSLAAIAAHADAEQDATA